MIPTYVQAPLMTSPLKLMLAFPLPQGRNLAPTGTRTESCFKFALALTRKLLRTQIRILRKLGFSHLLLVNYVYRRVTSHTPNTNRPMQ